jgi:hypothetical protein
MANDPRSAKATAFVSIGIGVAAVLFGVVNASDRALLVNGSLWAGVGCLLMGVTMLWPATERPIVRRVAFIVAGVALLMSLYSAFELGRQHRRASGTPAAAP